MKPCDGTFARNAATYGVAGINVDACRIGTGPQPTACRAPGWDSINARNAQEGYRPDAYEQGGAVYRPSALGRFPANLILDEDAAALLDEQSGDKCGARAAVRGTQPSKTGQNGIYNTFEPVATYFHGDTGGASRFFYCAKASRSERDAGLEGMEEHWIDDNRQPDLPGGNNPRNRGAVLPPTIIPPSSLSP